MTSTDVSMDWLVFPRFESGEITFSLCLPIIPRKATAVYWLANLYVKLQNASMVLNPKGLDLEGRPEIELLSTLRY